MTRRDPWLFVGFVAFLGLVVLALFGERLAPHEAIYFVPEHGDDPRPYDPGLVFPFGSDILGRDLFSVVLAGARATLTIVVLSGLARVVAGCLVAAFSSWWRPTRLATESLAELASAVPATLVALLVVKVFLKTDPSLLAIVSALLLTGWAGPYRVIRAEVDRVRAMDFTQGALAIGVGRWRLFWRHHLPHLAPVLAVNLSQQIVASLVLVAELGVLSIFVSATRFISIEESLSRAAIREIPWATIGDPPEWGGLLASARTIESLWTTRWLFLVPGVAFAITALAVAVIGFALARRYARRDVTQELRGRGAVGFVVMLLAIFLTSALLPERYAAAREWAAAARAEVRPAAEIETAFVEAGLVPIGATFAVQREAGAVAQTGAATVKVGQATVEQVWPRRAPTRPNGLIRVQSLVTANTGGGVVEAPLVFLGRGVSPSAFPVTPFCPPTSCRPDIGRFVQHYADDYATVDVRGKVVLLLRFVGVAARVSNSQLADYAFGPPVDESIATAIKHGAAAVIFVDSDLANYTDEIDQGTGSPRAAGTNPYLRLQNLFPPISTSGVPVVVLDPSAASTLIASTGVDLSRFYGFDEYMGDAYRQSPARDLGVTARVEVPLAREHALVTSYVAEVGDVPDDSARVLIWGGRTQGEPTSAARDVLAALARTFSARRVPIIFVDFDPAVDAKRNAKSIAEVLQQRRISLVVVLDRLDGSALQFTTAHGDLIPALDHYAEKATARYEVTRTTATASAASEFAPLLEFKTVIVRGNGGSGDLRPDAAALLGYLAGRLALGAEELPR